MSGVNTIAAIKRLQPGTKLILVNSLVGRPKTDGRRTLKKVRSNDVIMMTPDGRDSYLSLHNVRVVQTELGFTLFDKDSGELCAAYLFEDQVKTRLDELEKLFKDSTVYDATTDAWDQEIKLLGELLRSGVRAPIPYDVFERCLVEGAEEKKCPA